MSIFDVKACRSCLTVKGKLEKIGDASKRQYSAVTGLQISENDGYPTYFCMECRHHIRRSLAFRRKSRRAHFVLKEIMSVRKQVTYSDIVTVNRKRTNLESSLSFWEPNNNACFLIANREGEEGQEESLEQYNLQSPKYSRSYSKHLVEIKPEFEPEETSEIPAGTNEKQDDDTFNNDDIPTNDYLEPDPNIDMNDIFKDFADENENHSEDEEDPKPVEKDDDLDPKDKQYAVSTIVDALTIFDLKALTLEEQKERMEIRRSWHPYANALFKCAVCLTTYNSMKELLEHVEFHNKRLFENECEVCKKKYRTVEELNIHVANCHMYDYHCQLCRQKAYSQTDAVKHAKVSHPTDVRRKMKTQELTKTVIKRALQNFTLSPLTHQMMYDVMTLRSRPKIRTKEDFVGGDPSFNCDICNTWIQNRGNLVKHMILLHRYMYTCKICKEVFTVRDQALAHNDTHKKRTERFSCKQCGKAFDGEAKLSRHRKMKHIIRIPCNVCGLAALNEKLLYKHQLRQHKYISLNDPLVGDPNHKCLQCGVQFMGKRALETHLVNMNHTGAENVEFACIPCKKIYDDEEQLETHYITCNYSRKYPRKCCYCPEVLTSASEYKSHYFHKHPSLPYRYVSRNSICDVCGKSIFKPFLESHLRTHWGAAHLCRLCDAAHAAPAAHVAHVLRAHARRPYHCAVCAKRFRFRSDCKDHILKVHAPTMLYKCEFCGEEFSYFRNLKDHSETLHNLVIPPIRSKFQFKSKNKIFVYAHMKIHINELEKPMVEQTEIELVDYLEQKSKPVNYSDYFVFIPEAEAQESLLNMKKRTRRAKVKQNELEEAVATITIPWPEEEVIGEPTEMVSEINDSEIKNSEFKENSELKSEMKVEVEKSEMEVDMAMPLEVIENEGTQYVMINGEMYRIACEDEIE